MNHFFTTFYIILGLLLMSQQSQAQTPQKCGQNTRETVAVVDTEPYKPKREYHIPKTDRPLISEQTKLTSKQSKRQKKRMQQWWQRQSKRKKGCPAAKF